MIAVSVHEMIPVTSELLAKLLQDLLHLVLSKVGVTEVETLLVFELLSQLSSLPGTDVEYAGEGEGMATVGILSAVDLQTRVIDSNTEVTGVVIGPEHVVYVQYDRLPGDVQYGGLLHLLSLLGWGTEWQLAGPCHHLDSLLGSRLRHHDIAVRKSLSPSQTVF